MFAAFGGILSLVLLPYVCTVLFYVSIGFVQGVHNSDKYVHMLKHCKGYRGKTLCTSWFVFICNLDNASLTNIFL